MFTFTTDGIVVENIILYICVYGLFYFFLLFYLLLWHYFNLDVIGIVFICSILFYFILFHLFISLYPDDMGNYVFRSCDVIASYVWQME